VTLPADAKLTISGYVTHSTSAYRVFVSPPLAAGKSFYYTLKAEFVRAGKTISVEQKVFVRAGRETAVSLDVPAEAAGGLAYSSGPGSPETRSYYYEPESPPINSIGTSYVPFPAGGAYGVPLTAGRDTVPEDKSPEIQRTPIFWGGDDPTSPFHRWQ
jgi:uncharacterized protein (TIGR03000 family)